MSLERYEITGAIQRADIEVFVVGQSVHDAKCTVSIYTGILVEYPKRMELWVVPMVRLQFLDDGLCFVGKRLNLFESAPSGRFSSLVPFVEGVGGAANWERSIWQWLCTCRFGERPGEVVESNAHVLQAIPDDRRHHLRQPVVEVPYQDIVQLGLIMVEGYPEWGRLKECVDFTAQFLQMSMCSS
jgi:hypothetical protein